MCGHMGCMDDARGGLVVRAKKHYIESHCCSAYVVGERIFTIGDEYTYQPGTERAILKNVYNVHEIEKACNYTYMYKFMMDYGLKNMFEIENFKPSVCD